MNTAGKWIVAAVFVAFGTDARADYTWGISTAGPYSTNYSATGDPTTLTSGQTLNILSNTGNAYLDVALVNNGGSINNQGIFSFQSPAESLTNSAGNMVFAANSGTYGYGCPVTGTGCAVLSNTGTMVLAGSGVSTAYTQFVSTGTMSFDLSSASNYGSINLGGSQNMLGGQFSVSLEGGFTPTVGEVFDVVTAGGYSGAFSNTTFTAGGATFKALYSGSSVDLTVTSLTPPVGAPEIDPASAASGLTLLIGGLIVLRSRRQQSIAA
jgi:hypothetical protein